MQEKRGEDHISNLPLTMRAGRGNQVQGAGMGVLSGHKPGVVLERITTWRGFLACKGKKQESGERGLESGEGLGENTRCCLTARAEGSKAQIQGTVLEHKFQSTGVY